MDLIQEILDKWCLASSAKFNLEKSKIIPLVLEAHRNQVIAIRKINIRDHAPLDKQIKIARDDKAIRILGVWIRNYTNEETLWEPIIDKIQHALTTWNRFHPTLKGRKLVIQMVIGGLTQFLTKAQGMPQRIEDTLIRLTHDFIWQDNTHPRIALRILFHMVDEGRLNLLDLSTRNKAIEIIWLKTYLDLFPKWPIWAKLTDIIINAAAPRHTNPQVWINTFFQTWNPSIRGEHVKILNKDIRRIIKITQKYKLTINTMRLSPHLKTLLPAWYHLEAEQRPMGNPTTKCLIQNHNIKTIVDTLKVSARLRNPMHPHPHEQNQWCLYSDCILDHLRISCRNPYKCATEALERLQTIFLKLNPLHQGS